MSPLKTSVIVAMLSGLATAGGLFKLRQERWREARHLEVQNSQMRLAVYQRNQALITSATPAMAAISTSRKDPAPASAGEAKSAIEYYRNEGNATPLDTLQTFAWACDRGDVELVGRLILIDEAARPKAQAFRAGLPEKVRAQWKTVDEMAAAMLTESIMARPFPNADILETATVEPISAGRVKLRMPNVPRDGTEYQQTADGWKYVITEKMVDAYLSQMRQPAQAVH